jgi:transposase-like protein
VVKIGKLSYDQYYKCRNCNKHFSYTQLDEANPQEIQYLLSIGIHRYAIARKYGCTHNAINKYIKKYNLIEPAIERVIFKS